MAEFKEWESKQKGSAATPDVIKSVIDDDVKEAAALEETRSKGRLNRKYNDEFIPPVQKRELAEEEPHHEAD